MFFFLLRLYWETLKTLYVLRYDNSIVDSFKNFSRDFFHFFFFMVLPNGLLQKLHFYIWLTAKIIDARCRMPNVYVTVWCAIAPVSILSLKYSTNFNFSFLVVVFLCHRSEINNSIISWHEGWSMLANRKYWNKNYVHRHPYKPKPIAFLSFPLTDTFVENRSGIDANW